MRSGASRFRRSRWASVIGVLGVVVSGAGMLGAAQDFFMPKMLEIQRGMLAETVDAERREGAGRDRPEPDAGAETRDEPFHMAPETVEALEKFADLPSWYSSWAYLTGTVRLGISLLYLCSSILLLTFHVSGIRLLLAAAAAAVGWNVVQCIVALSAGPLAAMMTIPHAAMGSIFHVVLIVSVVSYAKTIEPEYPPPPAV